MTFIPHPNMNVAASPHHDGCDHNTIGKPAIGGFPGHEHIHSTGRPICFDCMKTIKELIDEGYEAGKEAGRQIGIAETYKDGLATLSTYKSELRKKIEDAKFEDIKMDLQGENPRATAFNQGLETAINLLDN